MEEIRAEERRERIGRVRRRAEERRGEGGEGVLMMAVVKASLWGAGEEAGLVEGPERNIAQRHDSN